MNTPSRREFFTYAAAATLASALAACQTKKETTLHPLVVDVIGPMAFQWSGELFELWMPDLTTEKNLNKPGITKHQAGIMTTVTSFELNESGDYKITGPSRSKGTPTTYSMPGTQVYQAHVQGTRAENKYIYMSLPMPRCIVVLDPVQATISGSVPRSSGTYAVGVRLFYDHANKPELWYPNGNPVTIPLYASPLEKQTNMLIGYAPYDSADPNDDHAKASFHEVSLLFPPLDLQVEFAVNKTVARFTPCMSPALGLV